MLMDWTLKSYQRPLVIDENLKAGLEASQYQRLQECSQYEPTQHDKIWSSYMKEIATEREIQLENSRIVAAQVTKVGELEAITAPEVSDMKKEWVDEDVEELEKMLYDASVDLSGILKQDKSDESMETQIPEKSGFEEGIQDMEIPAVTSTPRVHKEMYPTILSSETEKPQDSLSKTSKGAYHENGVSTIVAPSTKSSVKDSNLRKEISVNENVSLPPTRSSRQLSPLLSPRGRAAVSPSSSYQRTSLSKDGSFQISSRSPERLTPHTSISSARSPGRLSPKLPLSGSPQRTSLKLEESEHSPISAIPKVNKFPQTVCVDPEQYRRFSSKTADTGLGTCRGPCMKWYEETYGPFKEKSLELPKPPIKDYLKSPDRLQRPKETSTETSDTVSVKSSVTPTKTIPKKFCIESCKETLKKFGIPFNDSTSAKEVICPGPCERYLPEFKVTLKKPEIEDLKSKEEKDTSDRFEEEVSDAFMHVKTCGSCCKDIGPTVMNVLKKVEEISEMLTKRGCMKAKPVKGIVSESPKRPSVDVKLPTPLKIPELPSFGSFDMDKRNSADEVDFGEDGKCILEPSKSPPSYTDSQIEAAFEDPLSHMSLGSKEQVFSKIYPHLLTDIKLKEKPFIKPEETEAVIPKPPIGPQKVYAAGLPFEDKSDISCKMVCWEKEGLPQISVPVKGYSTPPPLSKCDVLCWEEKAFYERKKSLPPADGKLPMFPSFGSFNMNSRISADDVDFGEHGKCLLEPAKTPPSFTDSQLEAAFEDPLSHMSLGSKEQLFSKTFPHIFQTASVQKVKQKDVLEPPSDKSDMACKVICWDKEIQSLKTIPPAVITPSLLSTCDLVCWDKDIHEVKKSLVTEKPHKKDVDPISEITSDLKCETLCWGSEVARVPKTSVEYQTVPSIETCDLVCYDKTEKKVSDEIDIRVELTSRDKMGNIEVDQNEHLRDRTSETNGASKNGNSETGN